MVGGPLSSPVVVDGIVSEEKVAELLALQTEYPELDYKRVIDLSSTRGVVELAKDVGAKQVRGGYIIGGVDGGGVPTGEMDGVDRRPFDEANLTQRMLRYLPRPLTLRTNVVERDGHEVFAICVMPNPDGCAFFTADGIYEQDGEQVVVFRTGDVYWRDGTRSVRMGQEGLREVIERQVERRKWDWMDEQQEIRRREREELETAYEGRRLAEGPLGAVNLDLSTEELNLAALDLVRRNDAVALHHLLNDAISRGRGFIELDDLDGGLGELLDKLSCLSATFLTYEQSDWLDRVLRVFVEIYGMPVDEDAVRSFGYSTRIRREEVAPRVWLAVIERVFGLGALAVRGEDWTVVRNLTLQLPRPIAEAGYDRNWLRHALTMASRAQQLEEEGRPISLLSLARNDAARLECLRSDGLGADDERLLTSLAQFDFLSNVVALGAAESDDRAGRVFYTNFARFRQTRIQAIANRLISDEGMRASLFPRDNEALAAALYVIGDLAASEGWRYDGFEGWVDTPVGSFIERHLPDELRE